MVDELWAIAAYFNPFKYRTRLRNFRTFRRHLNVPLVVVELSTNGSFELAGSDAERLLQVRSSAVLWHKERLLNLALSRLPASCRMVAWLDGDIVFLSEDWSHRACLALKDNLFVQMFGEVFYVLTDAAVADSHLHNEWPMRRSVMHLWHQGEYDDETFSTPEGNLQRGYTPGLAWAARREFVEAHRLYDAGILGGGDKAMFSAACGRIDEFANGYGFSDAQLEHFRNWARPFFRELDGSIASVDGSILHLWHGDLEKRKYRTRLFGLREHDFNPYQDITSNHDHCWSGVRTNPGCIHTSLITSGADVRMELERAELNHLP